jgi:hypothetical protein
MNNTVFYESGAADDIRRKELYDGQLFVYCHVRSCCTSEKKFAIPQCSASFPFRLTAVRRRQVANPYQSAGVDEGRECRESRTRRRVRVEGDQAASGV